MKRLHDKTIVITGGSDGIDCEASRLFAREGAVVLILELNAEADRATVEEIFSEGGRAKLYPVDISDYKAVSPYSIRSRMSSAPLTASTITPPSSVARRMRHSTFWTWTYLSASSGSTYLVWSIAPNVRFR